MLDVMPVMPVLTIIVIRTWQSCDSEHGLKTSGVRSSFQVGARHASEVTYLCMKRYISSMPSWAFRHKRLRLGTQRIACKSGRSCGRRRINVGQNMRVETKVTPKGPISPTSAKDIPTELCMALSFIADQALLAAAFASTLLGCATASSKTARQKAKRN